MFEPVNQRRWRYDPISYLLGVGSVALGFAIIMLLVGAQTPEPPRVSKATVEDARPVPMDKALARIQARLVGMQHRQERMEKNQLEIMRMLELVGGQ